MSEYLSVKPFEFVKNVDSSHLLNFIQQEHPQTIAMILAYLEPDKASAILQSLPNDIQSDVAQRIAFMDRISPEILRIVDRTLEHKFSTFSREAHIVVGGIETIVEILNLADRTSEKQIIEALEDEDLKLAEEIKKRMIAFEDIVKLDDQAIQKAILEIPRSILIVSLKLSLSEIANKLLKPFGWIMRLILKWNIRRLKDISAHDVIEAQNEVLSIIRGLSFPRGKDLNQLFTENKDD